MSPTQLVRDLVERKSDLLYAAKAAAANLSQGQHFPEYLGGDDSADLDLLLAAIALGERPIDLGVQKMAG